MSNLQILDDAPNQQMLDELFVYIDLYFKENMIAASEFWNKPCKFFSGKSPCETWFECPESVLVMLKYYPAFRED
jgi:hypothetical protein